MAVAGVGQRIAIDGKTLGGVAKRGAQVVHLLEAVSHKLRFVLGQVPVDDKTNEITVILPLLDLLVLRGRVEASWGRSHVGHRLGRQNASRADWAGVADMGTTGIKVGQKVEQRYEWAYLNLAVNGIEGKLCWRWTPNMKQEGTAEVVEKWQEKGIGVLIWEVSSHRARRVKEIGGRLIEQPSYAPKLNPSERILISGVRWKGEYTGILSRRM